MNEKIQDKTNSSTRRIAKNTLMLYFRQILIMVVSLYTVRVVLNTLGAQDYGIYNVVAGVVTMFSFLSGAMATASQRYFSFALGEGNKNQLNLVFNITFQIYLLLSIIVVFFAETIGLWFINNKLIIPTDRLYAVNCIYQSAIFSFLMMMLSTPYKSMIIAYENMTVYAYVSIIEVGLKLATVCILRILSGDKLILYGILLAFVSLTDTTIYCLYCRSHYGVVKLYCVKDITLFKELFKYSGWNLFGSIASVVRNQGTSILLNIFFGTTVNAPRAISVQVNGAVSSFAQNFSTALRPQIIKSYAAEKKDRGVYLVFWGTKIVFFLMLLICVPLFFQVPYILQFWLGNVPEFTTLFVRLVIIEVLVDSASYPMMAMIQATGKIRLYQIIVGGLLILNLPLSFLFLQLGYSPIAVYIVAIFLSVIAYFLRAIITQKESTCSLIIPSIKLFILFILLTVVVSIIPALLMNRLGYTFWDFCLFILVCITWGIIVVFVLGFNKEEKKMILAKLRRVDE